MERLILSTNWIVNGEPTLTKAYDHTATQQTQRLLASLALKGRHFKDAASFFFITISWSFLFNYVGVDFGVDNTLLSVGEEDRKDIKR